MNMFSRLIYRSLLVHTALLLASCKPTGSNALQGYVEGDYTYVSSPLNGQLVKLAVKRGDHVPAGAPLFSLDDTAERASRAQAAQLVLQAKASLEDAKKGKRPSELAALQAQLKQATEAVALSERELVRQEALAKANAIAVETVDKTRSTNIQDHLHVEQVQAELKTAQLGARSDLIASAEAVVRAAEAALAKQEWEVKQKSQLAPQAGVVEDTLYQSGEWVAAGRPVVSLLSPANVKVRLFVPETKLATLHTGDEAMVHLDGLAPPLKARVSFISTQAEYTPPVIYNRENRSKLVFMVELRFDDATAATLHPGQPVDVDFSTTL